MSESILKPSTDPTSKVVFWIFHLTTFSLLVSMYVVQWYLAEEEIFEIAMAQIFVYSALFTFLGSKFGGYLGAVMEEDPCGGMDMGVLSTLGGFLGATTFALAGTALVGLYFFVPAVWLHIPITLMVLFFGAVSVSSEVSIERTTKIDCCGKRLDDSGKPLRNQPMPMKNKLAILLGVTAFMEVVLTLLMIFVMRRDLANQWMLGGMMYGMGGAMIGGFLGGWLAGLLDRHEGEAECDNPIMVCGMSLMGGMMGGMLAGMIGGMNALMGPATIVPTLVLPLLLIAVFYFWLFRREFVLKVVPRGGQKSRTGELSWQKS